MSFIEYQAHIGPVAVKAHSLEVHQEYILELLNFPPEYNAMENLVGSDIATANILFVKKINTEAVKSSLDKIFSLQADDINDLSPFHYLEFDCGEYTIFIHNYESGMDECWTKDYFESEAEILAYLKEANKHVDFSVTGGSENNDYDYFMIMLQLLAQPLEGGSNAQYEEELKEYIPSDPDDEDRDCCQDYGGLELIQKYAINIEQVMYFYMLSMEYIYNPLFKVLGRETVETYMYEKVNQHLKDQ